MKWWRRWFYRLFRIPLPPDTEAALRAMLQKGIEIGKKQAPPIIYRSFCQQHEIPLQQIGPGIYACPLCQHHNTEPLPGIYERPLHAYLRQQRAQPSDQLHTRRMRAIHHHKLEKENS